MAKVVEDVEPTSFENAIGNENRKNAMDEEIAALVNQKTWELVPLLEVRHTDAGFVLFTIYVDDLIIVGDIETEIEHVKGLFKKEFEMKDLGELCYFLGLEVIRTTEGILLSQRQYALDMLSKYGMADCKPISMSLDINTKLSAHDSDVLKDLTMYHSSKGRIKLLDEGQNFIYGTKATIIG
ncbi:hypothetical protein L7F22_045808 [Adiantum nelumboides]|nr:hypothetical protein [Adiantum nelumboides]